MKKAILMFGLTAGWAVTFPLYGEVVTQAVEYAAGDLVCEGFHAFDKKVEGRRPAVLIVHQWTGLSDHEKERAVMLAELGYNVLALDVYGKGVRPQPPEAGKVAGQFKQDRELLRSRLKAGLEALVADERTDADRVAVIGYCFGGMGAVELARSGAKLVGAVSFHGSLDSPTPADGKRIRCEILALHGDADPFVPKNDVAAFEKELQDAKVSYELVRYPNAVHAFTQKGAGDDPSKGAAYDAAADKASWEEMKKFFARVMAQK